MHERRSDQENNNLKASPKVDFVLGALQSLFDSTDSNFDKLCKGLPVVVRPVREPLMAILRSKWKGRAGPSSVSANVARAKPGRGWGEPERELGP